MAFSREDLKEKIKDFISESSLPFTSRDVTDSLKDTSVGRVHLSPQRMAKFIKSSNMVDRVGNKWKLKDYKIDNWKMGL